MCPNKHYRIVSCTIAERDIHCLMPSQPIRCLRWYSKLEVVVLLHGCIARWLYGDDFILSSRCARHTHVQKRRISQQNLDTSKLKCTCGCTRVPIVHTPGPGGDCCASKYFCQSSCSCTRKWLCSLERGHGSVWLHVGPSLSRLSPSLSSSV